MRAIGRAWACAIVLDCAPRTQPLPNQETACITQAAPADGKPIARLGKPSNGAWSPLANGDRLTIAYGSQGGHHVYVEVLTYSDTATTWAYQLQMTAPDGTLLSTPQTLPIQTCAPGWTRTTGIRLVFDRYLDAPNGDAVIQLDARPIGTPLPDLDAGAPSGPLDQTVAVKVQ
jgi:hypothetical protein